MNKDIERIMVSEEDIQSAVARLAKEIDRDYCDAEGRVILLAILKGSVVFMGDLMKRVTIPVEIDFMKVSSYGADTKSGGRINVLLDLKRHDLDQCHIIVVEDIIDSGRTLSYLVKYLLDKGAKSVRTCTLLDKPSRREVNFVSDYVGYEVEDEFVVGYGLDYDEKYRALPYIGILRRSVYSSEN